jgi:hypothetical protein
MRRSNRRELKVGQTGNLDTSRNNWECRHFKAVLVEDKEAKDRKEADCHYQRKSWSNPRHRRSHSTQIFL